MTSGSNDTDTVPVSIQGTLPESVVTNLSYLYPLDIVSFSNLSDFSDSCEPVNYNNQGILLSEIS